MEDNSLFISVVAAKRVTPIVKHVDITVCSLQEQFENGLFIPKYEKSSVIPAYICTKPYSGPIISRITKWTTELILYPTSDTKHYQLMGIHDDRIQDSLWNTGSI